MSIELTEEQALDELAEKLKEKLGLGEIVRNFVPVPDDARIRVKPIGEGEPFGSLGEQLKAIAQVALGGYMDNRLYTKAATGLGEEIDSAGGYLLQEQFVNQLIRRVYDTGVLAKKCRKIQVGANSNGIVMPAVDETSRVAGSRWGGVRGYWAAEGGTKTASAPKFARRQMLLEKWVGLAYATDELLQDAVALESIIGDAFVEECGFMIDDAIINGTGAGQPLGILNAACLVSVAKETGQAATTIVTENIIKMYSRLWARSIPKAIWLINQDIQPQLFTMSLAVGTGGIPVYMPANGLADSPYGRLMGRPVMPIEHCQTLGAVGDIYLADFSEYLIIEKGGIQGAQSIHVSFTTDQTAFRFVYRINGQPTWDSALTPYKGSNTQSPFVALAVRS